jgi:hypothetical protein
MAILVPRWLDSSWQVRLQMSLKVCMVIFANRTRAQTRSAITFYPHQEVLARYGGGQQVGLPLRCASHGAADATGRASGC